MNIFDISNIDLPSSAGKLGIAFVLAYIAGTIAKFIKVPKVTAYILVGIILGPSVFDIFTEEMGDTFNIINEVAFGLILFNIGGEFHRELFKKFALKNLAHSSLMALVIFLVVTSVLFALSFTTDLTLFQKLAFSSMLGVIAIAAAPPTTLIVIKDLDAEGPMTHLIMIFLAIGTILTIILSRFFTIIYEYTGVWTQASESLAVEFGALLLSIAGALAVGVVLGFILSLLVQREKKEGEVLLAVICVILFGQTLAHMLHLDPLLVSLVIGFSLVNMAPTGTNIHVVLKDAGSSIYALFFVLAGSHIHIQEQIETVGILGVGYIFARIFGLLISSRIAAKVTSEPKVIGKFMGPALLSHAGAAIAIAMSLQGEKDASAQMVITVVLGSIFFFEVVGPLSLKYSLKRIGEVGNDGAASTTTKVIYSPRELIINFFKNTGILKSEKLYEDEKTISHYICKNIMTIDQNATFSQVLKFINDNQLPLYTVIGEAGLYVGTISFDMMRRAKGRFNVGPTQKAKDLIDCKNSIHENTTINDAIGFFVELGVSSLPVITEDSGKLIGIVHYKDIVLA